MRAEDCTMLRSIIGLFVLLRKEGQDPSHGDQAQNLSEEKLQHALKGKKEIFCTVNIMLQI